MRPPGVALITSMRGSARGRGGSRIYGAGERTRRSKPIPAQRDRRFRPAAKKRAAPAQRESPAAHTCGRLPAYPGLASR